MAQTGSDACLTTIMARPISNQHAGSNDLNVTEKNRDFLKKIGSNFHVAEKSLTVEFKNPAEFILHAAQHSPLTAKNPKKQNGGERGIRTPHIALENKGNPNGDTQRDTQIPVNVGPDLSRVVTAWEKLPAPLKAAILAIVGTAS